MTICKNLTDEQVKAAFEQFDTSGDDKLDYRQTCKRWLTIYIDNYRRRKHAEMSIYSDV